MKISLFKLQILLGAITGGLTFLIFGFSAFTWQYYVIMLPAAIVIMIWTRIFYNIHKNKRERHEGNET
jgi:predicted MFS family arabinose efflux permease